MRTGVHRDGRAPLPAVALALGGAVPFLAAAAMVWVERDPRTIGWWVVGVLTYGAVVLSFLGGARWGAALDDRHGHRLQTRQFLLAAIPAAAAWAALLVPPIAGIALLVAGLLLQGLWDTSGAQSGRLPGWYGRLRGFVTALSVVALIAVLSRLVLTDAP